MTSDDPSLLKRPSAPPWLMGVWPVQCLLVVVGVLTTWLSLPGEITVDSLDQLSNAREGVVSDWHSPMLIHVWRLLLQVSDSQGSMIVVQQLCYWTGALLLVGALVRSGRQRAAWGAFAVAVFPHFLFFNHYILKDVAHYGVMFLAVGLLARPCLSTAGSRWWIAAAAVAMLAACFIRLNGAFAVAPLVLVLFLPVRQLRPIRLGVYVAIGSVVLILAVRQANVRLFHAVPSDVEQSLQLFDLAGIHHYSGDAGVWGGAPVSQADIDKCYTAFFWDTFGPKGLCGYLRDQLGADQAGQFSPQAVARRKALWVDAVVHHPVAYLQHRISHLNSELFFVVPALHGRFNKAIRDGTRAGRQPLTERDIKFDYLKKSFLIWPVVWLVAAAGVLSLLWPAVRSQSNARMAVALLLSALGYGLAYAVVGVATDVRYFLWVNLSVLLALVIGWPVLAKAWQTHPGRRNAGLIALVAVVVVGLVARLADVPFT